MMTLKLALIAMIVGSSTYAPMHFDNANKAIECPRASLEVTNQAVNDRISKDNIIPVHNTSALELKKLMDTQAQHNEKAINKDKTYDQCMREAFERIYEEVNRMLDEVADNCNEQFQLQKTA